ncbi:MAG: hypothetical protein JO328_13295 [Hyphomicrobiales bacterium]|nr:hypothetical protein [Hyphomicrobiales bacterium]MBV8824336.1 hypothetical protein [Hyphomicrobiales bacterium]
MTEPHPTSALAARNAPILAAMAQFAECAAGIVSVVMRRAQGGDPVCLKLCLARALPVGRLPPPIDLVPGYDPANLNRNFAAIGALVVENRINIRQASRLLDSLGAPPDRRFAPSGAGSRRLRPAVAQVRKFAEIEAGLAKALAALGMDDFVTVAPRAPGGIGENYPIDNQTNTEQTP